MYVRNNLRWRVVWGLARRRLIVFTSHNILAGLLCGPLSVHVPGVVWQPVALLGTAVACYIGFKGNGSHDRCREGRQLWGSSGHSSRMWAVRAFGIVQALPNGMLPGSDGIAGLHRCRLYRQPAGLLEGRSSAIEAGLRELLEERTLPPGIDALDDVPYPFFWSGMFFFMKLERFRGWWIVARPL